MRKQISRIIEGMLYGVPENIPTVRKEARKWKMQTRLLRKIVKEGKKRRGSLNEGTTRSMG